MKSARIYTGSHLFKGGIINDDLIIINYGFNSVSEVKRYLSEYGIPIAHKEVMIWLIGCARIATTFLEEWLACGEDVDSLFQAFKERYTKSRGEGSIIFESLERFQGHRVRELNGLDVLELLERAVLKHWYTGLPVTFISEETLELFELGVARLDRVGYVSNNLRAEVNEPLVVASAIAFFKSRKDIALYILDKMADMDYNSSAMGYLWEHLIPEAVEKLFSNKNLHHLFNKKLPTQDWQIKPPPEDTANLSVHI